MCFHAYTSFLLQMPEASDLIEAVKDQLVASGLTLILEPGRSLLGNAATLITTVLGTKRNGDIRWEDGRTFNIEKC